MTIPFFDRSDKKKLLALDFDKNQFQVICLLLIQFLHCRIDFKNEYTHTSC